MEKNHAAKDRRYKIAAWEARAGIGLAVLNFVLWFAFAYGLGSRPVSEYHYILGFPDWFFYSCIVTFIIVTVAVIFVVVKYFREVPLDDTEKGNEE